MAAGALLLAVAALKDPAVAGWWGPVSIALLLAPVIAQLLGEPLHPGDWLWRATRTPEERRRPYVAFAAEVTTRWLRLASAAPASARRESLEQSEEPRLDGPWLGAREPAG